MRPHTLTAQFCAEMDCPKEIVMWNYYDHEHLVGTHFKLYNRTRVLAERDNWSLVLRSKRMPLLPIYTSGIGFRGIRIQSTCPKFLPYQNGGGHRTALRPQHRARMRG
jgi:hypothetical protein